MKEFKTIPEQIAILENRGMIIGENAAVVLLREKYYSMVNGYKDPFLDKHAMQDYSEDLYIKGTRFEWLEALYNFDRKLRQITFSYLIRAEAALKTATVYAFCEAHRGSSDYLHRGSFCTVNTMLTSKTFRGNKTVLYANSMNTLMKILNEKLAINPSSRPFIVHYMNVYGEVPLWVLAKDLTFGNMSHFYQLMQTGDQNEVCKNLYQTTLRGKRDKIITRHEVLRAYNVLSKFRNLCAHDERLYCAKIGNDTFATMTKLMEVALPASCVVAMKQEIADLLEKYGSQLHVVTAEDLRNQLGV